MLGTVQGDCNPLDRLMLEEGGGDCNPFNIA